MLCIAGHNNQTENGNGSTMNMEWLTSLSGDLNQLLYSSEMLNVSSTFMTPTSTVKAMIIGWSAFTPSIIPLSHLTMLSILTF